MSAKQPRRLRWRRALAGVVIVIGALSLSLYAALATTEGTRFVLRYASQFAPVKLSGIHGNVIGGVVIDDVALDLPSAAISLKYAQINLDLWPLLFTQELRIAEFASRQVTVTTTASSASSSNQAPPALPALPIRMVLRRMAIDALVINAQTPISLQLDRLRLINQQLDWRELRITRDNLTLTNNGIWRADTLSRHLESQLHWSLPTMQGTLELRSDFESFNASGQFALTNEAVGDMSGKLQAKGTMIDGADLTLNLDLLQGQALLTSHVAWRDAVSVIGRLEGHDWQLHTLKGWPIDATATSNIVADIEAGQVADAFTWQLPHAVLNGHLGDAPLRVEAKASGRDRDVVIESLIVRHLATLVEVTGDIRETQARLKVRASAPNIRPYSATLQGDISLDGDITASLDSWQETLDLNISATSENLAFGDTRMGGTEITLRNQGRQLNGQWRSHFIHSGELALENIQHTLNGQFNGSGMQISGSGNSGLLLNGQRLNLPTLTSQWQWYKAGDTLLEGRINATDERVTINIASRLDRQQHLDAQGDVALLNLNWLTRYQPRLANIDGNAQLHMEATGSLASSEPLKVSGRFSAAAPQTQLIDPDIQLNDSLIQGELSSDGRFTFSGQALQAERPMLIEGQGRLTGPELAFTIDAEQLRAVTPAVDIRLSPSLAIQWQPKQLTVRGKLDIPKADISFSQLPNPSFSHSSDVIVVGRASAVPEDDLARDISVKLHLDENVLVKAAGLATKLRGDLLYTSLSGKPVQLQGKLDLLDGRLASQNGDLSIKRGSLIFSGKPDNPAVDIIAVRQIDSPAIEVGLHLTGSLQDLRTAVVSFPAMDQSRALSYLVFGRDITQEDDGSGSTNAQLMSAAISLGIGQSSRLMQSLKRGTGLDELAAVANDSGSALLIAGKQINSKLYARYRYDMAEALGVLLLRYKLSQRWTLEAESGVESAMDIMFELKD